MRGFIKVKYLLFLALVIVLALPAAIYAIEPEGSFGSMQIEYRYEEGETPVIPETIVQFGITYHLVSQSEPVLESSLPQVRTYRYRIEGALTPEQLEEVKALGNIELTPVNIVKEYEYDTEIQLPENGGKALPTNDVDDIPLEKFFWVPSGSDPSGLEWKKLARVGVSFSLAGYDDLDLPIGYTARVVYRGIASYAEVGYYLATATFMTSETLSETPVYVIVAEYQTDMITPEIDEDDMVIETPVDSGLSKDDEDDFYTMIERQGPNPFTNLIEGNVPLGNRHLEGVWSFLSLVFSTAGIAIAAVYAIGAVYRRKREDELTSHDKYDEEKLALIMRKENILRTLVCVTGLIVLASWLYLDDFTLGMVWINKYTMIIGLLLAVTVVLCAFTNIHKKRFFTF